MRVSKIFYQVAGPLLYRNIVIDFNHPTAAIAAGDSIVDRDATRNRAATVNLKRRLLSLVKNMTISMHDCTKSPSYGPLLRIDTLLIVPRVNCRGDYRLCMYGVSCPTLARIRPQKVVLHHIRLYDIDTDREDGFWGYHPVKVKCPTLTLVLDEVGCGGAWLEGDMSYRDIDLKTLENLRVVVHETPKWLDDIAGRIICSDGWPIDIDSLAKRMLGPIIAPVVSPISITIYLFSQLDSKDLASLRTAIDTNLSERRAAAGIDDGSAQADRPTYALKTLSDYITEGLEDELLPEELEYWREEYQKRLAPAKAEDQE